MTSLWGLRRQIRCAAVLNPFGRLSPMSYATEGTVTADGSGVPNDTTFTADETTNTVNANAASECSTNATTRAPALEELDLLLQEAKLPLDVTNVVIDQIRSDGTDLDPTKASDDLEQEQINLDDDLDFDRMTFDEVDGTCMSVVENSSESLF